MNDSARQRFNGTKPFWRNVVLIALAHVALVAGLVRWSVAARGSPNPESIVWLGDAGDAAAGERENEPSGSTEASTPKPEFRPSKHDEPDEEKSPIGTAKSEIELPSPTPKLTSTPTPRPKVTPTSTPKPKITPKPIPKTTPKKTVVAKAKPTHTQKSTAAKSKETTDKNKNKAASAKTPVVASKNEKTDSVGKGGHAGGGNSASEFGWYGNMLHDRFYSAWIQPTANVASGAKISTLVKVRIEKDGRVSKFEIIKPSQDAVVNESVATVSKRVSEVDAPPVGLVKGDHYDIKINFELNTGEQ